MINGERIRLRAPERKDIPSFVKWLNDPEVQEGISLYLPLSHAEEEEWFENMLRRPANEHLMTIEVHRGEEWIGVGNCGYHELDWRCRVGVVGIFIGDKSLWSQGIGTDAMRLLIKHGFDTLNLNRGPGSVRR